MDTSVITQIPKLLETFRNLMLLFYYPRFETGIQNDLVDLDSNHITDSKI